MGQQFDQQELEELARELLDMEFQELSPRKQRIIQNIAEGELTSKDPNRIYTEQLTFGQRFADAVAHFGGSWSFIITALLLLSGWIVYNVVSGDYGGEVFDPYPFILLNLGLSMLAALQAPIIMMSQNRRAAKDRIDSNANYETCLKIELDLTRLHQRMDDVEEKLPK